MEKWVFFVSHKNLEKDLYQIKSLLIGYFVLGALKLSIYFRKHCKFVESIEMQYLHHQNFIQQNIENVILKISCPLKYLSRWINILLMIQI